MSQDQTPLLYHMSLDTENDNTVTKNALSTDYQSADYGAIPKQTHHHQQQQQHDKLIDDGKPAPPSSSSPLQTTYDVVNHGHAYSDALIGRVVDGNNNDNNDNNTGNKARDEEQQSENKQVSYWSLLRDNENFRFFMLSYLVTIAGEWFTYVASISAMEQIHASHNTISRTSISILVAVRLLPNAIFSNVGGVLADSYDRRTILIILDLLGCLIAWCFLLAYYLKSIPALYMATAMQMTVAAIYEPSHSAITPMIVLDKESLKKALTLGGLAWSLMTSAGSSMGGFAVGWVGIPMCFVIDSVSYFMSALFIWKIEGKYRASDSEDAESSDSKTTGEEMALVQNGNDAAPGFAEGDDTKHVCTCCTQFNNMSAEGFAYLRSKPWGAFVFLKGCAAMIYGAADVLNVAFSERGADGDVMQGSSERLGILFAFVGIGCFMGPIIAEPFTNMDRPESLERVCWISYLSMAAGCWGLSKATSFGWVCVMTSVRSAGSSVVWIDSSLLLQKFSSNNMLGRVMAVDYAIATLSEAFSAMAGGILQDDVGMSAEDVSFVMAWVGVATLVIWGVYFHSVRL